MIPPSCIYLFIVMNRGLSIRAVHLGDCSHLEKDLGLASKLSLQCHKKHKFNPGIAPSIFHGPRKA